MSDIDATFKALADPIRREIIYLLSVTPNGMSKNEISGHFNISRQGTAKHLKILEDSGIVSTRLDGREKICLLNPLPLQGVLKWLEFYKPQWSSRLSELTRN